MTTSNCTGPAPSPENCRLASIVGLPHRGHPRGVGHNRRIEVRRVMRPTTWRTSTHLIVGVGVLAIVAALVAAAALLTGSGRGVGGVGAPKVPPPPQAVTAKPGVVPVADSAATPTKSGLAAALAAVVADPNLGKLGGRVTDALTGEELWSHSDDLLLQPASTNKTLTTAAALLALDRNARVTTRVVAADQSGASGVIVLVGGGDQTLSR